MRGHGTETAGRANWPRRVDNELAAKAEVATVTPPYDVKN
jgi:hypothetical protein